MGSAALVLGGARSVWQEFRLAEGLFRETDWQQIVVVATNHAGRDYRGRVDHWCTMHPDLMKFWMSQRSGHGLPDAGQLWTTEDRLVPGLSPITLALRWGMASNWHGSTGLLGVTVCLEKLGIERVLLCGVPLSASEAHYDRDERWTDASNYRLAWMARKNQMMGRVRSMSGWTAGLLGQPDPEWLERSSAE